MRCISGSFSNGTIELITLFQRILTQKKKIFTNEILKRSSASLLKYNKAYCWQIVEPILINKQDNNYGKEFSSVICCGLCNETTD